LSDEAAAAFFLDAGFFDLDAGLDEPPVEAANSAAAPEAYTSNTEQTESQYTDSTKECVGRERGETNLVLGLSVGGSHLVLVGHCLVGLSLVLVHLLPLGSEDLAEFTYPTAKGKRTDRSAKDPDASKEGKTNRSQPRGCPP
jgi:hypothetical protein